MAKLQSPIKQSVRLESYLLAEMNDTQRNTRTLAMEEDHYQKALKKFNSDYQRTLVDDKSLNAGRTGKFSIYGAYPYHSNALMFIGLGSRNEVVNKWVEVVILEKQRDPGVITKLGTMLTEFGDRFVYRRMDGSDRKNEILAKFENIQSQFPLAMAMNCTDPTKTKYE